eukprot:tig00001490_g8973.t1
MMRCLAPEETESSRTVQMHGSEAGIDSEMELALRGMQVVVPAGPAMLTFSVREPLLNAGQRLLVVGDCVGSFDPERGVELVAAGTEDGEAVWRTERAAVVLAPAAVRYAYVVVDAAHALFEPVQQRTVEVAGAGCCVAVADRWRRAGHLAVAVGPAPRPEPAAAAAAAPAPAEEAAEAQRAAYASCSSEGEGEGEAGLRRSACTCGGSASRTGAPTTTAPAAAPSSPPPRPRLRRRAPAPPVPKCCPEARPAAPAPTCAAAAQRARSPAPLAPLAAA